MKWRALSALCLLAGCIPRLTGAPCHTDTNCPVNQYCDGANCLSGPPPPTRVVQVLVSVPAGILPLGSTVQATATALLQSGANQDVTAEASWSSSNELVAQVSNDAGTAGTVLAVSTGQADVIATLDSNSGTAHVVVTDAQLVSLLVTVDRPVVAPLSDVACTATGFFTDGSHADLSSVANWTSSLPAVVSVSTTPGSVGALVALSSGTAEIAATYQQFASSTSITVTDATLQALAISPLLPYVTPGTNSALQATGLFSDGTAQPVTNNVQWTVDDPSLAFFLSSVPGELQGFSPGSTEVDVQAGLVMAQAPLVVSAAALAGLEVAPAVPDPLGLFGTKPFYAWGTFADQGLLPLTTQAGWSSSAPALLAVSPTAGTASALDAGVASVEASFAGSTATAQQTIDGSPVSSLLVWPPRTPLTVGLPGGLAAERVLADGTVDDATQAVGWASSCPGDVQVSTGSLGGALVARSPKSCTVTAELNGLSNAASVTATARLVQRLEITPANVSIGAGGWTAFAATAVFSDGSFLDVTPLAAWTASNPGIAIAGNGPQAGQVLAADAGACQLTATFGNANATAALGVANQMPVLELWPPLLQIHAGTVRPLQSTAIWPSGDAVDVTAWTVFFSSSPSVAAVANAAGRSGQLAGLSPGLATITALFGPSSATATVAVDATTVGAITLSGTSALPQNESMSLHALAHYLDGSQVDVTRQSSWTSSATGVLRVRGIGPQRGTAVAVSPGSTTVGARFQSVTGSAQVTATGGGVQSLSIVGLPAALPVGVQLQLVASASFPGDVQLDVTSQAVWTSSSPAVASASTGPSAGVVTALLPGVTQLTATFGGAIASASLNVSAASLLGLTLLPAGPSGPVGIEVPLQAQGNYSDGTQFDLTGQARWSSVNSAQAAISNGVTTRGVAMALVPGSTTLSASVQRPDGTLVTENTMFLGGPAVPVGVDVLPASVVLSLSTAPSTALRAVAHLSDGSTRDVSSTATWSVQAPDVASVTASGELTAVKAGTTTVSATFGLVSGSAAVSVVP